MKSIEANEWMILNNLIYKIYSTDNIDEMREIFLDQIKLIMDFDSAIFYRGDYLNETPVDPICYNCEESDVSSKEIAEYLDASKSRGKCIVYREEEKEEYVLKLVLGMHQNFLGIIVFTRNLAKENFHYDDIFLLDSLKEHLAFRLGKERESIVNDPGKLRVTQAVERYGLTKREHMILKELISGKDNEVICDELGISVNTLKKHILNVYRKLGIKNRVQMFKMIKEYE